MLFNESSCIIHMSEFGRASALVLNFCVVMNMQETSSSLV